MSPETQPTLSYRLAEKNFVLVVSISGELTKPNLAVLEKCRDEVLQRQAAWVVLCFKDVGERLDHSVLPSLAQIQKQIRGKPSQLRITSLHPNARKFLEARGLLRPEEVCEDLLQALQAIQATPKVA